MILGPICSKSQQNFGNTGENKKATSRLRVLFRKTHNPEVAGSSPAAATKTPEIAMVSGVSSCPAAICSWLARRAASVLFVN